MEIDAETLPEMPPPEIDHERALMEVLGSIRVATSCLVPSRPFTGPVSSPIAGGGLPRLRAGDVVCAKNAPEDGWVEVMIITPICAAECWYVVLLPNWVLVPIRLTTPQWSALLTPAFTQHRGADFLYERGETVNMSFADSLLGGHTFDQGLAVALADAGDYMASAIIDIMDGLNIVEETVRLPPPAAPADSSQFFMRGGGPAADAARARAKATALPTVRRRLVKSSSHGTAYYGCDEPVPLADGSLGHTGTLLQASTPGLAALGGHSGVQVPASRSATEEEIWVLADFGITSVPGTVWKPTRSLVSLGHRGYDLDSAGNVIALEKVLPMFVKDYETQLVSDMKSYLGRLTPRGKPQAFSPGADDGGKGQTPLTPGLAVLEGDSNPAAVPRIMPVSMDSCGRPES